MRRELVPARSRRSALVRLAAFLVVAVPLVSYCGYWLVVGDADVAWTRIIPLGALLVLAFASRLLATVPDTARALFFLCLLVLPAWFSLFRGGL